jgi:MYXO-CTERM domain-containing protein
MRKVLLLILLSSFFLSTASGQELVLDDPLTSAGGPPKAVQGGSFSAAGWTRDTFESKIIYDLGRQITHGRIEFEMDGVNGTDHGVGGWPDCRAIFAAVDSDGAGNLGNQNIWVWAMDNTVICNGSDSPPYRTNKMKLLLRTLTDPEPGEPMSPELNWDETHFYKYEVTWDENGGVLVRDGVVVLENPFDTPRQMHLQFVFLGTINRYRAGVGGATYRNLKVWDLDAQPGEPDAGPPDAGGDDAGGGDEGTTTEVTLSTIADTHVISTDPDANFGTIEQMCSAMGDPWWYVSFMRFDISGVTGPITSATLHMTASNTGFGGQIYPMTDNSWVETTVTFSTRPSFNETVIIDQLNHVESGDKVTFDLTGHVPTSGLISFAIANSVQGDGCCYRTREAQTPGDRPVLVIEYNPDAEPQTEPDAGTGDDAGVTDAGTDEDPGTDETTGTDEDETVDGCGCQTRRPGWFGLVILALILFRRR